MLKMFNKEKSEVSERGKANQPIPWGSIICQIMLYPVLLLLIYLITAPVVYYLRTKVAPVMSDEFTQILLFSVVASILVACIAPTVILWNRRQHCKLPHTAKGQDGKSKGGLPKLEWILNHQGCFLILCIPASLFITASAIKFAVIPAIMFFLPELEGSGNSVNFTDTPVLSLALVVASVTFAVTIWRGYQTYDQIRKVHEQNEGARFQNAVQMATDRDNPGRCVSGLRTLESMYKDLKDPDRETVYSAALYVLSIRKGRGATGVSKTARQWALDILVEKEFLSQERLQESMKKGDSSKEMSVRDSTIEKDFSHLHFTRQSKNKDTKGNKILDLSNFSFHKCKFNEVNFRGTILNRADLSNTNLLQINLSEIDFSEANFEDAYLREADLSGANFENTDLSKAKFVETKFLNTNLGGAKFYNAELKQITFHKTNFINANFHKTNFHGSIFWHSNLNETIINQADISDTHFFHTEITNAKIFAANLNNAYFRDGSLKGTKLYATDLSQARFINVECLYAENLEWAYCTKQPVIEVSSGGEIPIVKSWEEWKDFIKNQEDIKKPDDIEEWEWLYMKHLAEEDNPPEILESNQEEFPSPPSFRPSALSAGLESFFSRPSLGLGGNPIRETGQPKS